MQWLLLEMNVKLGMWALNERGDPSSQSSSESPHTHTHPDWRGQAPYLHSRHDSRVHLIRGGDETTLPHPHPPCIPSHSFPPPYDDSLPTCDIAPARDFSSTGLLLLVPPLLYTPPSPDLHPGASAPSHLDSHRRIPDIARGQGIRLRSRPPPPPTSSALSSPHPPPSPRRTTVAPPVQHPSRTPAGAFYLAVLRTTIAASSRHGRDSPLRCAYPRTASGEHHPRHHLISAPPHFPLSFLPPSAHTETKEKGIRTADRGGRAGGCREKSRGGAVRIRRALTRSAHQVQANPDPREANQANVRDVKDEDVAELRLLCRLVAEVIVHAPRDNETEGQNKGSWAKMRWCYMSAPEQT
ncbi:hypothetical protein K438DRAFT_1943896 [Mycena galopus ATCC 62051]|nr:hypothetical protein K438DRAFT_1943896 [Mycena galopus ATCC 62051]